ncbi:hypothetical protein ATY76_13925 [Rhizobium sp. R339]|uniref:hypothetical protein n=1 Tax=Rhizobium sp. R339 TaxID=1764273 RepID=UPI000B537B7E|nr:hypothetical protein [Rhizobium sp. R339]OWV68012.1 hypothetical protein ATY76_13925 [Rhizobium sp. R339]
MAITKLDAARRQLLAAIHLHWFLVEPLAVYQLAANVSEVCDKLLEKSGGTRIKKHVADDHGWEVKHVNMLINSARNFMKHADRDPAAILEDITFDECTALLLTACIDYTMAAKRSPPVVGVFIAWFAAAKIGGSESAFSAMAGGLFPGLAEMSQADQILAARRFVIHPMQGDILHDSRNELSDSWRWNELRKSGQDFRTG